LQSFLTSTFSAKGCGAEVSFDLLLFYFCDKIWFSFSCSSRQMDCSRSRNWSVCILPNN
jgi:hypothetical protein